jgi:DNA adenine methylase
MTVAGPLAPFLKWPGGKRWAAWYIASKVRERLKGRYIEPFLGGGAVFFHLRPSGRCVLSDVNKDLVNIYRVIRDHSDDVIERLKCLRVSRSVYYRLRAAEPTDPICRATRFLYLNRTAFGGMYRVNVHGEFNVPYGGGKRTPAILWETSILRNAAAALKGVALLESDFEAVLDSAAGGDVVYCDPTYTVTHDQNGFVRYNERNFSWSDQERLAKTAFRAAQRGAGVIVSNAHHREVRKLYRNARFETLARHSALSPAPSKRRVVKEYLIVL